MIQRALLDTFRGDLSRDMTRIARRWAPKRSGLLHERIETRVHSRSGRIFATLHSQARNPQTGYPYTGVTRKGHRRRWIYPKRARFLRFEIDGRVIFARRVRGYRPKYDWGERAAAEIDRELGRFEAQIGRRIVSRIF